MQEPESGEQGRPSARPQGLVRGVTGQEAHTGYSSGRAGTPGSRGGLGLGSFSFVQVDMISLAKQIIEATPERIKREDFVGLPEAGAPMRERTGALGLSETMSWLASYLENVDHFPSSAPPR